MSWLDLVFPRSSYTPVEVAKKPGKSPESIYRAIRRKELGAFKVGPRSYVIPTPALKEWLLGQELKGSNITQA